MQPHEVEPAERESRPEIRAPQIGSSRDGVPASESDGDADNPAHPLEDLYAEPPWRGYVMNRPLNVPSPSGESFAGRGPKGYRRPDERIYEDVCDALTDANDVDATGITVSVTQGEVMLSGEVDVRFTKRRAEEIAESVRGVRDVHNRLTTRTV